MSKTGIPQRIAARRAERRRRVRRQRLLAAAGLLTVAATVVALVASDTFPGLESPDIDDSQASAAESGSPAGEAGRSRPEGTPAGDSDGARGDDLLRNAVAQPGWRSHTGPVPILMYHVLDEPAPDAPYPDLYLSAEDFRSQIGWLAEQGYEAVTLRQVERAWWRGGRLPEKPIVLSFDDGYVSHYEVAFPAMKEHGWPGLLNLKAGETDIYKRQVREMLAAGWELGSHTIDHPDLTTLDATALADELTRSRQILRRRFGVPVSHLCYPAGRYDDTVAAAAEAAGYSSASTTDPGLATAESPFRLKRIRINRGDGPEALAAAGL